MYAWYNLLTNNMLISKDDLGENRVNRSQQCVSKILLKNKYISLKYFPEFIKNAV